MYTKKLAFFILILGCFLGKSTAQGWKAQTSNTTELLLDVSFIDANTGWAASIDGSILHTTDGGTTWTVQKPSNTSHDLLTIYFVDAMNGWAAGKNHLILRTTDGGMTWNTQTSPPASFTLYDDLYFQDVNKGWLLAGFGRTVLYTNDGGTTWNHPTTINVTATLWAMAFADDMKGWAVGSLGTLIYTTDGGVNWTNSASNTNDQYFYGTTYLAGSAGTGWAVGHLGVVYKTTDAGVTWTKLAGNVSGIRGDALHFLTEDIGYITGSRTSVTVDGGVTWRVMDSNSGTFGQNMVIQSQEKGWVVGDNGVIKSLCPCNISAISLENISSCSYDGTNSTFTANVRVTYFGPSITGNLKLSGDGTATKATADISLLSTSYVFGDVSFPADGGPISLTATFDGAPSACTFTNSNLGTAPSECACTASMSSSDTDNTICAGENVTFTGSGGTNYDFLVNNVSVQSGTTTTYSSTSLKNGDIVKVNTAGCTSSEITMVVNALPTLTTSATNNTICVGDNTTFTGNGAPVSYASSDPSVATISSTGEVVGVKVGTTTITYMENNGCNTTASLIVKSCLEEMDFTISDPCSCDNPRNVTLADGTFLFEDSLSIDATGITAAITSMVLTADANLLDATGAPITTANLSDFTDKGGKQYTLQFFTRPNAPSNLSIDINSGNVRSFTTISCSSCQETAPIPTMNEWGLLIFGLLILNMGILFVQRKELA